MKIVDHLFAYQQSDCLEGILCFYDVLIREPIGTLLPGSRCSFATLDLSSGGLIFGNVNERMDVDEELVLAEVDVQLEVSA